MCLNRPLRKPVPTAITISTLPCSCPATGIGENSAVVRELACKNLSWLGIEIDQEKNRAAVYGVEADISTPASTVRVWVIPTDEEVSIAQQTLDVLQS